MSIKRYYQYFLFLEKPVQTCTLRLETKNGNLQWIPMDTINNTTENTDNTIATAAMAAATVIA